MPTYLKYKYIFSSIQIKVRSGFFSSAEPDSDTGKTFEFSSLLVFRQILENVDPDLSAKETRIQLGLK